MDFKVIEVHYRRAAERNRTCEWLLLFQLPEMHFLSVPLGRKVRREFPHSFPPFYPLTAYAEQTVPASDNHRRWLFRCDHIRSGDLLLPDLQSYCPGGPRVADTTPPNLPRNAEFQKAAAETLV
jgi:hypothetical protein